MEQVRRDFVANASHELKTPAASIQAAAETLADAAQNDPAAVARFAPQLERDAQRLSRIVADLLDLSRLEVGSDLDDRVRLDAVVRDEVERYEFRAQGGGADARAAGAPAPAVRGSARDLSLLVRNLIDNAVRYTREGGTVEVAVEDGERLGDRRRAATTGSGSPRRTFRGSSSASSASTARARAAPAAPASGYPSSSTSPRTTVAGSGAQRTGPWLRVHRDAARRRRSRTARAGPRSSRFGSVPSPEREAHRTGRVCCRTDDDAVPDPPRAHRADGEDVVRTDARHPARSSRAAQAELLVRAPDAGVKLTAIYSSPLERCVQTVEPLAAAQRLRIVERPGLIEMDAGTWTGKPLARLRRTKRWTGGAERPSTFRFPQGESFSQALERVVAEVDAIARRHRRGRVAVATHGDIVRILLAHLEGRPARSVPTHGRGHGIGLRRSYRRARRHPCPPGQRHRRPKPIRAGWTGATVGGGDAGARVTRPEEPARIGSWTSGPSSASPPTLSESRASACSTCRHGAARRR